MRAFKIFFKAQNIVNFGPAPAVNRLVIIADTANIIVALRQQAQPEILHGIGILVFIDQNMFETLLIFAQHRLVFAEQAQTFEQ